MTDVFIALGSNIDPENHLKAAAVLLREQWGDIRYSGVYLTEPMEHRDQSDFLNAVAAFRTEDAAHVVQQKLQAIERSLKKDPPFPWGPRTIDLDLLLHGTGVLPAAAEWAQYQDAPLQDSRIVLPHPRMHRRRFVLEPLSELLDMSAPHPVLGKTWSVLLEEIPEQGVRKAPIVL
jgi:2-amino-4-hydroxy-6-hydroxymethyldihydropteridine diphosphokinase